MHEETTALSRDFAAHLRSSAKEMDTIFASAASVDDWNRKTGEIFAEHTAAQNAALAEEPAMFALRPPIRLMSAGQAPGLAKDGTFPRKERNGAAFRPPR